MFILKKNGRAVIIESPCFYDNNKELAEYLKDIEVKGILVAYHGAGTSFMTDAPKYATQNAFDYSESGSGKALIDNFSGAFSETFDNKDIIREMYAQQKNMKIHSTSNLIPRCPYCGKPLTTNLRADNKFVQNKGWYKARERYRDFIRRHKGVKLLFPEFDVSCNTPIIIKYPFWQMTAENPNAVYACINKGESF